MMVDSRPPSSSVTGWYIDRTVTPASASSPMTLSTRKGRSSWMTISTS
jgi:hypothetical protein